MKTSKTAIHAAFVLAFGAIATTVQAATLANGDLLTITASVPVFDANGNPLGVSPGSYFGLDANFDYTISALEKNAIAPGGDGGLRIGVTQHARGPGDADPEIDTWELIGYSGHDYTSIAPIGGTVTGIDFSGWRWHWKPFNTYTGQYDDLDVDMGSGAWQPLNCVSLGCAGHTFTDGVAWFQWDGVYGHGYTLDYAASVPAGDPSGFGGAPFYWHFEGVVQAVPVPAAVWLFGSGLVGLMSASQSSRRKI